MAVTGKKPSEWSAATIAAVQTATGINAKIENVVEDTTPQLGGDLDTQGNVIVGGTAVGSTLSLKSTTADGTLTAKALSVLTGNNGATEAVTVLNNGNVGIGNIAPALVLQGSTVAATPFTIGAGTPAQEASSVAGNALTLMGSNATEGSSVGGAAAGGNINITAGNAARLTSGNGNGGIVNITSGNAIGYGQSGAVNILSSGVGDTSGKITIKTGACDASGNLYLETGIPTAASSGSIYIKTAKAAGSEGVPGQLYLISGDGTNKYETGGNGGNINITPGSGGGLTGGTNRKGGNGANINLTSGAGANASGGTTNTGGNSGNITLDIGASGTGATANGTVGYVLLAPTRGNVGVGLTVPTAVLHIKAGTASVASAPLKFTSGTVNTAAETGAVEYDGTNLFFTRAGTVREIVNTTLVKTDTGDATGAEGLFQINTFDKTFKVYADGGWRSLATWS